MNLRDRMNGVLQRLGSPYSASPSASFEGESVIAALEAIEIRLDRLDGHLQFRDELAREEDLAILAGLAGITYDEGADLQVPVKAID